MIAPRLTGLALLCALAACHRPPAEDAANLSHAPNPAALAQPAPTPLPPEQALAAAFVVAFPDGGLIGMGDEQTQYVARNLAPLAGGQRVAVLADGTGVGLNTCHGCTGKLRITYVARQGSGFAPLKPVIARTIEGNGFGSPPDWKLDTTGPVPTVTLNTGYTGQGCTIADTTVWLLKPDAIVEDKKAGKEAKQGC